MARRRKRAWGSGSIYRATSGTWGFRWRVNGQRVRRSGYATAEDAERVLAKLKGDAALRREGLPPDRRSIGPLSEYVEGFLASREVTHATAKEDGYRWRKHLAPWFGRLRPSDIDAGLIRRFVEAKLAEGSNPATVRIYLAILSKLIARVIEDEKLAIPNPCRGLPDGTRALLKLTHDPRTTPFIEKLDDVKRIYLALREKDERIAVAYALGALAGLRTGEVFALRWRSVDLDRQRILVQESVKGPTKDRDPRPVPLLLPLLPVLKGWKLTTGGGDGLVVPPERRDGGHVDKHTPGRRLAVVLRDLGLDREGLGWYQATRHTFASHWAMAGRPLRELQAILGHSSIAVTERYSHLSPGYFAAGVHTALNVDLAPGNAEPGTIGPKMGQAADAGAASP